MSITLQLHEEHFTKWAFINDLEHFKVFKLNFTRSLLGSFTHSHLLGWLLSISSFEPFSISHGLFGIRTILFLLSCSPSFGTTHLILHEHSWWLLISKAGSLVTVPWLGFGIWLSLFKSRLLNSPGVRWLEPLFLDFLCSILFLSSGLVFRAWAWVILGVKVGRLSFDCL